VPTILELMEEYKVEYRLSGEHHHISESFLGTDCPYCSPNSGHFRLGFSLTSSAASCWSCGRVPAGEAFAMLIGKPAKVGWAILGKVERVGRSRKHRGRLRLPLGTGPLLSPHREYLEDRGFDPDELVDLWGLMGTGAESNRAWSLVIPVKLDYEAVSYVTRKLHDRGTRYLSARPEDEAVSAKEVLCGEDYATNVIAVTEGFFDMARIGPGAVCTMGLAISTTQIRRMGRYPRRLICFDSDAEAQRRARALCERLSVYEGETLNVTVSGKDVCVSPEREVEEIRRLLR
jgi:hypothetical protein